MGLRSSKCKCRVCGLGLKCRYTTNTAPATSGVCAQPDTQKFDRLLCGLKVHRPGVFDLLARRPLEGLRSGLVGGCG